MATASRRVSWYQIGAERIDRLDEDIVEGEDRRKTLEGSGFSRNRTTVSHQIVTDDEVREMFRTLRESS
jgi:hypothetical protein